jgi:hypothetical protein
MWAARLARLAALLEGIKIVIRVAGGLPAMVLLNAIMLSVVGK